MQPPSTMGKFYVVDMIDAQLKVFPYLITARPLSELASSLLRVVNVEKCMGILV